MKRSLLISIFVIASMYFGTAQEVTGIRFAADTVSADSLALEIVPEKIYDSYDDILRNLDGSVVCPVNLDKAMKLQTLKNRGRKTMGYRVRIYFDNSQNARSVSQEVVDTFSVYYPDVPVNRIYDTPYFKVTVGEFYTKSDAMKFITRIRKRYPSAFLVREPFSTI